LWRAARALATRCVDAPGGRARRARRARTAIADPGEARGGNENARCMTGRSRFARRGRRPDRLRKRDS
jgi:hypothetical protein